ncbi:MAG: hypothetical protein V7K27_07965 [Nostoc sp.]|uniref:hypothetical protein n=1 Tax=Nostoc sp. TaxID=1180 RepID=UPI002FF8CB36
MTNAQRLDHVEDELETVKRLLVSTASYAESANRRLDELTIKQDRTQSQLDQLGVRVDQIGGRVDQLSERLNEFVNQTQRLFNQQATVLERLEENQRSNNAALERIDRILDYLLRQQGNSQ